MKIGRSIGTQIAAHNNLKTGVHGVSTDYVAKSTNADQLIRNADVAGGAALAYAKLNLINKVLAADIKAAANIPLSKLVSAVCSETEADTKVAAEATARGLAITAHAGVATAHQDAPTLISDHAGVATAHQDAPTLISDHAGVSDAHHTPLPVKTAELILSDLLAHSNDAEKSTVETSAVKLKEVVLGADVSTCRIVFELSSSAAGPACGGQIYKNGSPLGSARIRTSSGYATFTQDFTPLGVEGDLIQIYAYAATSMTAKIKNMRFYNDLELTPELSITNQDP